MIEKVLDLFIIGDYLIAVTKTTITAERAFCIALYTLNL